MPDLLIQIADAIAQELNAAQAADSSTFSQPFTATRVYDYWRELEETTTLRVDVVPEKQEDTPLSRSKWMGTGVVSIAVRQKIKPENVAAVDALTAFVGELRDFWTLPVRRLSCFPRPCPSSGRSSIPTCPSSCGRPGSLFPCCN